MKIIFLTGLLIVLGSSATLYAQAPVSRTPPADPIASISMDLATISRSVEKLSDRLKAFVDKWEKVGGMTLTEKQQKLVLGMELLMRTEQRVANLQKLQIELTEKLNDNRGKLAKVDIDLRPRSINNSTVFEGTTETEELRENRRLKLQADRVSLTQLIAQINSNMSETTEALRDAQALAERLRRTFLPQVERELYDQ